MSLGNELTYILLLDENCISYRKARTPRYQKETQRADAIVDVHSIDDLHSSNWEVWETPEQNYDTRIFFCLGGEYELARTFHLNFKKYSRVTLK